MIGLQIYCLFSPWYVIHLFKKKMHEQKNKNEDNK